MSETVLISGHAGVGKSALVHHLQRELAGTGGIFAGGKADPFKRETPFGSLAQNATRPSGPPSGALAALLLLAGIKPASSSRLASTPDAGPLGRVQLPFLGLKLQAEYDGAPGRSDVSKPRRALCEEAMKEHQERLKGARVLLVEDNAINQDLATNVLARAGHRRHCGR